MLTILPNLLSDEENPHDVFSPMAAKKVASLDGLIAESEKAARRYLRFFMPGEKASLIPIHLCNEHTSEKELQDLLGLISKGSWGLISDAGIPCVADPGHELVFLARKRGLSIEVVWGPSSLILALQLSGLQGQRFSFHGYLPREEADLVRMLQNLEKRSLQEKATQIWIEAPYRSSRTLEISLKTLKKDTYVSVSKSLSTSLQKTLTLTVGEWQKATFIIGKEPAIFLLYA
jgi:16S rRNA (cytidine1402-2'-O)-methyltransferase